MPDEAKKDGVMRYLSVLGILLLTFFGCNKLESSTQTITASTDADGTLHLAELQLRGSARVTCLSAEGNNGSAAKCSVNGASVAPPKESVNATGKVYLLCEGATPLKCAAKVEQYRLVPVSRSPLSESFYTAYTRTSAGDIPFFVA